MILAFMLIIYAFAGIILVGANLVLGGPVGLPRTIKLFAVSGDGLSVGILLFSLGIGRYTLDDYKKEFQEQILSEYPNLSQADRDDILKNYYGSLKRGVSGLIQSDIGAILTALSTLVVFLSDLAGA